MNMNDELFFKLMTRKTILRTLLYLHFNGKTVASRLFSKVGITNYDIYKKVVPFLLERGLIERRKINKKTTVVELTERGREVTKKLVEISSLLRGEKR
ncbi:MAG: hypothetical protein DRP47_09325 [Candidatus Zixiibacteriota bacterium]|nr:MAG: hypothetical protein DRP47_09325 [candidate division Zixibacteria bacterium]